MKSDSLSDILSPPCCCCVSEKKIQSHKHHWSCANKHQGMETLYLWVCAECVLGCSGMCGCALRVTEMQVLK